MTHPTSAELVWLDQDDRLTADDIRRHGAHLVYAFAANRYYQRPDAASVPLLQLTYDDRDGRFPGEAGYANPDWIQPRPGDFRA